MPEVYRSALAQTIAAPRPSAPYVVFSAMRKQTNRTIDLSNLLLVAPALFRRSPRNVIEMIMENAWAQNGRLAMGKWI